VNLNHETKNMKTIYSVILALVILIVILGTLAINTNDEREQSSEIEKLSVAKNVIEQKENLTAWDIIKMTDWLFWPFIIITAAGILMIIYYALAEHQQKSRALPIFQRKILPNDLNSFIRVIKACNFNRASHLMQQVISTFNKTNRAEPIGDDVNLFLSSERESFETFNRVVGFLSDSAGALGLLGTVWGIFQTFHAGKLDGPTILKGMSISLVTTLVGLIISLLLNMGATYVFTLFNSNLKLITVKAEELRQALLQIEKKSKNKTETRDANYQNLKVVETIYQPKTQNRIRKAINVQL